MSNFTDIAGVFLVVTTLMLSACSTREKEAASHKLPNIVLFSVDTMRADRLGVYGHGRPTSPHIDAFAKTAVLFERAISQAPSTAPAHMSIFTGVTPAVHRVANIAGQSGPTPPDPRLPNLIEEMKERGYLTAGFHGGGNVASALGFDRGFHLYSEDFVSYNWINAHRKPDDLKTVERWIDISRDRGKPFFLFLHHYICHAPYISAPDTFRDRFMKGRTVEGLPRGFLDKVRYRIVDEFDRISGSRTKSLAIQQIFGSRLRDFWKGVDLGRRDHNEHIQAMYDAGVLYSDYLFEEVRRILKRSGVVDNTIVILTSDHGEEFHEHGGREHGRLFVEHLHVPLIIQFPGKSIQTPLTINQPVRTMDLLPTLFDYLKLPLHQPIQGVSFLPLITGKGSYGPDIVSYSIPTFQHLRVEKNGVAYTNAPHKGVSEFLFDIETDGAERRNQVTERTNERDKLRALVDALVQQDTRFKAQISKRKEANPPLDPRLLEQLKRLGYLK